MNEKALPVLEQYDYSIRSHKRVRGSYCCDTDKGLMLLKEYENSRGRIRIIEAVQKHLVCNGMLTDLVARNKEDKLISQGPDGGSYIFKQWFDYRECEANEIQDVIGATAAIARFHALTNNMRQYLGDNNILLESEADQKDANKVGEKTSENINKSIKMNSEQNKGSVNPPVLNKESVNHLVVDNEPNQLATQVEDSNDIAIKCQLLVVEDIRSRLEKHNRELVRVQRFLGKKKKKTPFEFELEECIGRNIQNAVYQAEQLSVEESNELMERAVDKMSICHGNCRHHNVLIVDNRAVLVNYIKVRVDSQVVDLYVFMRKVIEKNNFSHGLAQKILTQYEREKSLDDLDIKALQVQFDYPERLWKVANNYFNSSKTGCVEKNQEKLDKFISMEGKRIEIQ